MCYRYPPYNFSCSMGDDFNKNKNNIMKLIKLTLMVSLASLSLGSYADEAQSWQESWYIGGAVGKSTLTPKGSDNWHVTDDQATSKKLYTGVNITKDAGLEAFWADLGDADLKSNSQSGSVNYKAIGIAGVYKPMVKFAGIRPLAKLGIAKFTTKDKGEVSSKQLHDISLFMGAGAEYALSDNVNLRAEYERYDKDVAHYNLGLNWRPLQRNRHSIVEKIDNKKATPRLEPIPAYVPPKPAPVSRKITYQPAPKPAPAPRKIIYQPAPKPVPAPVKVIYQPAPKPVVIQKPKPAPLVIKKPKIQLIHSSLSGGSNFNTGSAQLTTRGQNRLNKLAYDIQASSMKVKGLQIVGHTDDVGNDQSNLALSLARANSVADYLQNLGVSRHIMRLDGKGESSPIASNQTEYGRAKNRRVEIIIKVVRTVVK
ncbi:MAG TPA: OmpA family protein [Leucothrix mucor]|uniref:OmpA family protein n=1 Tax=Leucothrix mucor TaxID=45248 RepID=A0A7V2WVM7_LEUMU|nr:OmpA family protein [Leucothrix mucor]